MVAMTLTRHQTRSVFERYNIVIQGDLFDAAKKLDEAIKKTKKLSISIVEEKPFMMACLKTNNKKAKEYYGFAKQCTYAPAADEWDSETGVRIAMARAVRSMCGKK